MSGWWQTPIFGSICTQSKVVSYDTELFTNFTNFGKIDEQVFVVRDALGACVDEY